MTAALAVTDASGDRFARALALHRAGDERAAAAYSAVLRAAPDHVGALVHFGALRLAEGDAADAVALLRHAVRVAPDAAEAVANLAAALQALGRNEEAIAEFRRAVALRPDLLDARYGLATCLQACGRDDEAMDCYKAMLEAAPDHAEAQFGAGALLARQGRTGAAAERFRAALAIDPDFAEASLALGSLLVAGAEAAAPISAEAEACFRAALDVDPDYVEAHLALARLLDRARRHAEAIPHFQAVLVGLPDHDEAIAGLVGALRAVGGHEEALTLSRRLVERHPDSASAAGLLGSVLAELGAIAAARSEMRRATALDPGRPELAYHLLQIARTERGDPALATLERLLPRIDTLPVRERSLVLFGLAKAYDDLGERDRGFYCLLRGNAVIRAATAYDEPATLAAIAQLERVFTQTLLDARGRDGDPSAAPVFIIGMPRSGTTLVEQVLASHPAVFGAGERPDLARVLAASGAGPDTLPGLSAATLRGMGGAYLGALRPLAPDAARITDKMPINFLHVGLIRLILPGARIIHCRRDPVDTCLSCFSKLFAGDQPFTYELGELGRFHHAYRHLMAHWRRVVPETVMLEIDYESLVADLEGNARRLVAHCGLDWDPACLAFHETNRAVHTASLVQVRQPIYRSAIGRWRPAPELLAPLLAGLEGR